MFENINIDINDNQFETKVQEAINKEAEAHYLKVEAKIKLARKNARTIAR
jgi:hypothetical protein